MLDILKRDVERDHPEVTNEPSMSGIYSHRCMGCGHYFMGYKRRYVCLKCTEEHEDV